MCGIFCSLSKHGQILPTHDIAERLQARGPDSTGVVSTKCTLARLDSFPQDKSKDETVLTFHSTVLSLRGSHTVVQPYQGPDKKFTLCWNGEAWSIDGRYTFNNDTEEVYELLVNASAAHSNSSASETDIGSGREIVKALSRINGPYAFVFFDHLRGRLFFGRDFLGRRSLMKRITNDGNLIISSVSDGNIADGWDEIEADGVYCIQLRLTNNPGRFPSSHLRKWGHFTAELFEYHFSDVPAIGAVCIPSMIPPLSLNKHLPAIREPLDSQSSEVVKLEELLRDSLSLRILNIPNPTSTCDNKIPGLGATKLAILFSGGLDCTVLARLSHALLPDSEPIDLLNVAFENPRVHKQKEAGAGAAYELCPDRITGRASYDVLQLVCPNRKWRFVAIDIPYIETQQRRDTVISMMHPHNTEMDLSIANALFFAARGKGWISDRPSSDPAAYNTTARVLLSGLGADELFAGYTRHATAFKRGGFGGLLDELELDVARLGKRNLGRDDRVMSHWGKEVRFPYLDENLLSWALNATVTEKCGFGEPEITALSSQHDSSAALEPGKKVLRCLAWRLGMKEVAKEKKRAVSHLQNPARSMLTFSWIQFGARTAKMENRRTKGTQLLSARPELQSSTHFT